MTYRNDPSPVTASFGRRARELRKEREWSLKEAAALASLTPGTLCRIERGADTTLCTAARVAEAYGVRLAVMLDPDSCPVCHDAPRRGFACQECGTAGPAAGEQAASVPPARPHDGL